MIDRADETSDYSADDGVKLKYTEDAVSKEQTRTGMMCKCGRKEGLRQPRDIS